MSARTDDAVFALRAFNRFHTHLVGALEPSFLGSGFSLIEARILYEIAVREPALASDIRAALGLDAGYLSRIIARMERGGLIMRGRGEDARQRPIRFTSEGRALFERVDADARARATGAVAHRDAGECTALVAALGTITALLSKASVSKRDRDG